jgi:hypothetical protein
MQMLTTKISKPFGILEHGPLFSLDECVDGHTLAPKQVQAAFDSCLGKDQKGRKGWGRISNRQAIRYCKSCTKRKLA